MVCGWFIQHQKVQSLCINKLWKTNSLFVNYRIGFIYTSDIALVPGKFQFFSVCGGDVAPVVVKVAEFCLYWFFVSISCEN